MKKAKLNNETLDKINTNNLEYNSISVSTGLGSSIFEDIFTEDTTYYLDNDDAAKLAYAISNNFQIKTLTISNIALAHNQDSTAAKQLAGAIQASQSISKLIINYDKAEYLDNSYFLHILNVIAFNPNITHVEINCSFKHIDLILDLLYFASTVNPNIINIKFNNDNIEDFCEYFKAIFTDRESNIQLKNNDLEQYMQQVTHLYNLLLNSDMVKCTLDNGSLIYFQTMYDQLDSSYEEPKDKPTSKNTLGETSQLLTIDAKDAVLSDTALGQELKQVKKIIESDSIVKLCTTEYSRLQQAKRAIAEQLSIIEQSMQHQQQNIEARKTMLFHELMQARSHSQVNSKIASGSKLKA